MSARTTTLAATAARHPAPHSALGRLVARHPAAAFLVMAFAFAWTSLLPLLLSERGLGVLPFAPPVVVFQSFAVLAGLALPAFLVAAATGGRAGVRELLGRALRWRVGVRWYLVALLAPFVAVLLAAIPFLGLSPLTALADKWGLLLTVLLPGVLVPFLHTNLPEEIGWTSLQARLQERHGPVLATVMVTPAFALFHLPTYFVAGWIYDEATPLADLPAVLLTVGVIAVLGVFFRLVVLWLYNGSGRSLLIAGLFHSAYNLSSGRRLTPEFVADPASSWLPTVAVVALGALVLAGTRGRLAYRRAPATPPAATGGPAAEQRAR